MEVNRDINLFYNEFIKYGLDRNNKLNFDEVADKLIGELKINKKEKFTLINRTIENLSYELYDIVSFDPFQLNIDK